MLMKDYYSWDDSFLKLPTPEDYRNYFLSQAKLGKNLSQTIHHQPLPEEKAGLPLVSVITVCYHSAKTMEETFAAVFHQTYPWVEYIVIDGGSTDGTVELIQQYEEKISYWHSKKDRGIYDAMNQGVLVSKGKIIGISNSDDYYALDAIEKSVNALSQGYDFSYGYVQYLTRKHRKKKGPVAEAQKEILKNETQTSLRMPFAHPSLLVQKKVYEQIGLFDPQYKIASDLDFVKRMVLAGFQGIRIPSILAYFGVEGKSSTTFVSTQMESYKITIKYLPSELKRNLFFRFRFSFRHYLFLAFYGIPLFYWLRFDPSLSPYRRWIKRQAQKAVRLIRICLFLSPKER